jgi:hypothetical protein
MLTRPGSRPGPRWLRRWDEGITRSGADPAAAARRQRWQVGFWVVFAGLMLLGTVLRWPLESAPVVPYRSAIGIGGVPLFAYGQRAVGIVAVGGVAVGVIAVGGVAVGGLAVGGVAAGGIALAGVAAGLVALAGLAVGGLAIGGGAGGYYAVGGLAVGAYAYAGGGVALGYHEASGGQAERLLGVLPPPG